LRDKLKRRKKLIKKIKRIKIKIKKIIHCQLGLKGEIKTIKLLQKGLRKTKTNHKNKDKIENTNSW